MARAAPGQPAGLTGVLPGSRVLKLGRKVVKNVAGLDLGKLWIGSRGCLGLCTRVIFKLQPRPPQTTLALYSAADAAAALGFLAALRSAGLEPAAHTLLTPALAMGMA